MEISPLNLIVPDFYNGPNLQAAVNQAALTPKAAVWIPSNYPGNDTYTNPSTVPIFDMRGSGSTSFSGGGGTPGGSNTEVQFNDSGVFGGDSHFTWNKTGKTAAILATGAGGVPALAVSNDAAPASTGMFVFIGTDGFTEIQGGPASGNSFISFDVTTEALGLFAGGDLTLSAGATGSGGTQVGGGGEKVAFYGAVPVVKPTVAGSKGGNAALASLITALATIGLVVDSTS